MRYKILFTAFLFSVCLLTACSGQDASLPSTTTTAESTTTTTSAVSTSTTQNQNSSASDVSVNTTHVTQDQPFNSISNADIAKITVYEKENGDMFSGSVINIGSITAEKEIHSVYEQITSAKWTYCPKETDWIKCYPVYAKRVLVFHLTTQKQLVLHIPYEGHGYISLGLFDDDIEYQDLFNQSLQDYKNGKNHFARYKVNKELVDNLYQLRKK